MVDLIPVEEVNGHGHVRRCDLIVLDDERRKLDLNQQSKPPKVLSVDSMLKASLTVLLVIVTGAVGYLFSRLGDHRDRIIRAEAWIEIDKRQSIAILEQLQLLNSTLSALKAQNSAIEVRLDSLAKALEKR